MARDQQRPPEIAAGLDVQEIDLYQFRLLLPRLFAIFKEYEGNPRLVLFAVGLLQCVALFVMKGATPSMRPLGIKARESSRYSLFKAILFSAVLPTIYAIIKNWDEHTPITEESEVADDDDHDSRRTIVARARRKMLARILIRAIKRGLPILSILATLGWWSGETTAPSLSRFLAGYNFIQVKYPQGVNVVYAHRRWLYEEILRAYQNLSPVSSWGDITSVLAVLFAPARILYQRMSHSGRDGSTCPSCQTRSITIPYITNCNHIYCYTCLWRMLRENEMCRCIVCNSPITSSRRL